jgi:Zn-dependent M28 family amino/carboxypeptidase
MPRRLDRTLAVAAAALLVLPAGTLPARSESDPGLVATIAGLQQRALADDTAIDLLRRLTVEIGPRFAGSPADRKAVEWAAAALAALELANVRREPVVVPRWVRGAEEGRIVAPHPQPLVLTALGGSVATPPEGLTAEVVEFDSLESLEAVADVALAGKIAFLNHRMERARDGSGYSATRPIRSRGPSVAASKGAIAMLMRSAATGSHRFAHTGATRYAEGLPRIPAAALAVPDADILEAQLAAGAPVEFYLALESRRLEDGLSANVVGEVIGRERPAEIVLLGAHLDSWDTGSGALDDGAGCAIVMAAARLIARLPKPPRRTIRVVLFANEEFGLSGARAYAERHRDALARHALATESDFGAGPIWRFATRWHPLDLDRAAPLAELLAPLGIDSFGNTGRGGADLIPLRQVGVPIADLTADGTYYFDYHHSEDDTFDKVDPRALAQSVAAMATLAYYAAEMPDPPRRVPVGETQ